MSFIKKISILLIGCFLLLWGCEEFLRRKIGGFAGSYPFVESWVIDIPEAELIQIMKEMKLKNPELRPPSDSLSEGERHSYWFFNQFYYSDSKEIVHTWVRPEQDSTKTTLALVSLSDLGTIGEHRLINRDFWFLANRMEIKKFERLIVNSIKEEIKKRKRSRN